MSLKVAILGSTRFLRPELDRADRHLVERIGHGQRHGVRPFGERQDFGVAQEIAAQLRLERRRLGKLGGGDDGEAEPLRQGLGHVALGHEPELRQERQEMLVAGAAQIERPVQSGRAELAAGDERLADGDFDRSARGENGSFLHDGADSRTVRRHDKASPPASQAFAP